MKHVLLLSSALAVAVALFAQPVSAQPAAVTRVTVKMTDFKFALSQKLVRRGLIVFTVVNRGEAIHDFQIKGRKTPIYEKGEAGTLRVRFTRPGRYAFICTVPGHTALGMKGVLRVR